MTDRLIANIQKEATKKVAVSESELLERAEEYAKRLENEHGYPKIDVDPYFAYGKYGFYFEFKDESGQLKQAKVDLGTKKECLEGLKKLFYRLADNPDWWLRRGKQAKKQVKVTKKAKNEYMFEVDFGTIKPEYFKDYNDAVDRARDGMAYTQKSIKISKGGDLISCFRWYPFYTQEDLEAFDADNIEYHIFGDGAYVFEEYSTGIGLVE